jgi:hypothetical protein
MKYTQLELVFVHTLLYEAAVDLLSSFLCCRD